MSRAQPTVPCLLLMPALLAAQQPPTTATLQVPGMTAVLPADVDLDGAVDLVFAHNVAEPTRRRELTVHLRRTQDPVFSSEPSRPPFAVPRDVVAFAFADVDPAPGRELILVTAEQVVAVVPDAERELLELAAIRLVWPVPQRGSMPLHAALQDLDGNGRDDLVVPEAHGWCVIWQHERDGKRAFTVQHLALPPAEREPTGGRANLRMQGRELRAALDVEGLDPEAGRRPLLDLELSTAAIRFVDLDGDGRRDAVCLQGGKLHWWPQAEGGFGPAKVTPLPLPEDRLQHFDPGFDVQLGDWSGRTGLLLTTTARRGDDVEVRIDRHPVERGDGVTFGRGEGRLRVQALVVPPVVCEIDGDGAADLLVVTMRVDLLRQMAGGGTVDAQLNLFRGDGQRFRVPAALQAPMRLWSSGEDMRSAFVHVLDRTAAAPAALLVHEGGTLTMSPLTAGSGGFERGSPLWSRKLGAQDWIERLPGSEELLIGQGAELTWLRCR